MANQNLFANGIKTTLNMPGGLAADLTATTITVASTPPGTPTPTAGQQFIVLIGTTEWVAVTAVNGLNWTVIRAVEGTLSAHVNNDPVSHVLTGGALGQFGQLSVANTWNAAQTIAGPLTVNGNASFGGTLSVGSTLSAPAISSGGTLQSLNAPALTPNYGLLNLGNGPFGGGAAPNFQGNTNGTYIALNAASGYTGDLINLQVAGNSILKVSQANTQDVLYTTSNPSGSHIFANGSNSIVRLLYYGSIWTDSQPGSLFEIVPTVAMFTSNGGNTLNRLSFASAQTQFGGYAYNTMPPPQGNSVVEILGTSATNVPLRVKGATSQTGDLQQWQNSGGVVLGRIDASGNAGFGPIAPGFPLHVSGPQAEVRIEATSTGASAYVTYKKPNQAYMLGIGEYTADNRFVLYDLTAGQFRLFAGQDGNFQIPSVAPATASYGLFNVGSGGFGGGAAPNFQGSASGTQIAVNAPAGYAGNLIDLQVGGAYKFRVDANSNMYVNNLYALNNGQISIENSVRTDGGFYFHNSMVSYYGASFSPNSATVVPVVINGAASQTADLQQWQNSAGTLLNKVDAHGRIAVTPDTIGATNLLVNAPTGETANLIDLQINGTSYFYVNSGGGRTGGNFTVAGSLLTGGSSTYGQSNNYGPYIQWGPGSAVSSLGVVNRSNTANPVFYTQGMSGQTGDLQQWQNSAGTVLAKIDTSGRLSVQNGLSVIGDSAVSGNISLSNGYHFIGNAFIGTNFAGYYLDLTNSPTFQPFGTTPTTQVPLTISGVASQTADYLQIKNGAGTLLTRFDVNGELFAGRIHAAISTSRIYTDSYGQNGAFIDVLGTTNSLSTGGATSIPLTVKGAASQTADLTQWQNSAGTVLSNVDSLGNIKAPTLASSGLTGSTAASRYVGATASGAPTTGTFAVGDYVIDQTGKVQICTVAGTPGTWVAAGGSSTSGVTSVSGTANQIASTGGTTPVLSLAAPSPAPTAGSYTNASITVDGLGRITAASTGTSGGVSTTAANTWTGLQTFSGSTGANQSILVKGIASQTGNLQEWQNSAGTVINKVDAHGRLSITPDATGATSLFVNTLSTETSPLLDLQRNSSSYFNIAYDGQIRFLPGGITSGFIVGTPPSGSGNGVVLTSGQYTNPFTIQAGDSGVGTTNRGGNDLFLRPGTGTGSGLPGLLHLYGNTSGASGTQGNPYVEMVRLDGTKGTIVYAPQASVQGLIVQGLASQTADLQQWQNSANTVLARIDASGNAGFGNISAPTGTISGQYVRPDILATTALSDNYVLNGDFEVAGTANGTTFYTDTFANLNGWDATSGATVASNVCTLASGGYLQSNFKAYQAVSIDCRFQSNTSVGLRLIGLWQDDNNNYFGYYDTGTFYIYKVVAGALTQIASQPLATTVGSYYWLNFTISPYSSGWPLSVSLYSDSAGAKSGQLGTTITITDTSFSSSTTGGIKIQNSAGGNLVIGGAYSNVFRVTGTGPANWTPSDQNNAGAPVWFGWLSDSTSPSSGKTVLAMHSAAGAPSAWWSSNNMALAATAYTASAQMRAVSGTPNPVYGLLGGANYNSPSLTVTSSYSRPTWTVTPAAGSQYLAPTIKGNGTLYIDQAQFEQGSTATGYRANGTNLVTMQNYAGNGIVVTPAGLINVTGPITTTSTGASLVPIAVKGAASQTADLQQWQDSTGTVLAKINSGGSLYPADIVSNGAQITQIRGANGAGTSTINMDSLTTRIQSGGATYVPLTVRGAASQTGNLQEWQNSAGTVLSSVDPSGNIKAPTISTTGTSVFSGGQVQLNNPTSNYLSYGGNGVAGPGNGSVGQKIQLYGTYGSVANTDYGIGIESGNIWFNTNGGYKWYVNSTQVAIMDGSGNLTARSFSGILNPSQLTGTGSVPLAAITGLTNTNLSGTAGITAANIASINLSAIPTTGTTAGYVLTASTVGSAPTWSAVSSSGGASTSTANTWTALQTFSGPGSATQSLLVKGVASQSGSLQEWQNSAGTVLAKVDSAGLLTTLAGTNFSTTATTQVPLTVTGVASQTANLVELKNSVGSTVFSVDSYGHSFPSNINTNDIIYGRLFSGGYAALGSAIYADGTTTRIAVGGASYIPLTVKGYASQTADLTQWLNSANTVVAKVDSGGSMYSTITSTVLTPSVTATPTIDYSFAGTGPTSYVAIKFTNGGSQQILGAVSIPMKRDSTVTNMSEPYVYLYSDNAGVPGTQIGSYASGQFASQLSTNTTAGAGYTTLEWQMNATLAANASYWIVLSGIYAGVSTISGGNLYIAQSGTTGGVNATSTNGTTWTTGTLALNYSLLSAANTAATYSSDTGTAISATSTTGQAISATSSQNEAIYGFSTGSHGVHGKSTNAEGAVGESTNWFGVLGVSTNSTGGAFRSTQGVGGSIVQNGGLTANSTSPTMQVVRALGLGSYTVTAPTAVVQDTLGASNNALLSLQVGGSFSNNTLNPGTEVYKHSAYGSSTWTEMPTNSSPIISLVANSSNNYTGVSSQGNVVLPILPAPSGTLLLTLPGGSGSTLTAGQYAYGVSFITPNGETAVSGFALSGTITAGQNINVNNIPIGPAYTTGRRIYRSSDTNGNKATTTTTATTYSLAATISDNTSTSYVDNGTSIGSPIYDNTSTNAANSALMATAGGAIRVSAMPSNPSYGNVHGGSALTSGNTSGTFLGFNVPFYFGGDFFNFQYYNKTRSKLDSQGNLLVSGLSYGNITLTGTYTLTMTDPYTVIANPGTAFTINLPSPSTAAYVTGDVNAKAISKTYHIVNINGTNSVTISTPAGVITTTVPYDAVAAASPTSASTMTLGTLSHVTLTSNGTNWYAI